jgi:hypothetical protein
VQEILVNVAGSPALTPVPVRETARSPAEEAPIIVSDPVALFAWVGSNATVAVAVWPVVNVSGVVIPLTENPGPVTEALEMVTGSVPEEVNVTDAVAVWPTVTSPKLTEVVLTASAAEEALRVSANVCVLPPAEALRVVV